MSAATETGQSIFEFASDTEVVMTRIIDAPVELVFDAHTQPEHLKKWLLGPDGWSMNVCHIDLRVGGGYRRGWSSDDGSQESFGFHGVFQEVDRPYRLVHTEMWGLEGDGPSVLCSYDFSEQSGRTMVTSTMRFESKEQRDQILATGMNDGIAVSYDRLDSVLAAAG